MKLKTFSFLIYVAFLTTTSLPGQDLDSGLNFRYDFSKGTGLQYRGNPKIDKGVLILDGKNDYAIVPNSSKMNIRSKGVTFATTVKLNLSKEEKAANNAYDMFISKDHEFIFGKWNTGHIYVNFHDGTRWCAKTKGGSALPYGEWVHVAAVIEYFNDITQSETGYSVSLYINGDKEYSQRFLHVIPKPNDSPIIIGNGFGGGPWLLNGEMANVVMYNRALTSAEIAKLCSMEKRVKRNRGRYAEIDPALQSILNQIDNTATIPAKWAGAAIKRAASNNVPQKELIPVAEAILKFKNLELDKFADSFNSEQKKACIILTKEFAACVLLGKGSGNHPLIGIMNRQNNTEIFGEKSIGWEVYQNKSGMIRKLENSSKDVSWVSTFAGHKMNVKWIAKGIFDFMAESDIIFNGQRIESSFQITDQAKAKLLDSVKYPIYSLQRLGKGDQLVHPFRSGLLINNPTEERFRYGQTGLYPTFFTSMQFGAYCDASKHGIYFACEDPRGRVKEYSADGKRGNLEISWKHPFTYDPACKTYRINGKAVLEVYRGGWYEAGQIYRNFLEKSAEWWIPELPRKSTPEFFRNNTLWIQIYTLNLKHAEDVRDELAYLRKYFELPFCVNWYRWNDMNKAGWPHFPAQDFTEKINTEIQAAGIYTVPYIDSRLWQLKDGPENKDWMFSSHGLKYAVKKPDGSLWIEDYGGNNIDAVMCPAVPEWQDFLTNVVLRIVKKYKFNGIYHDQVAASHPRLCFDKTHPHLKNDPKAWVENGYWKLYDKMFDVLHKNHCSVCHTSEESAEPFLKQFDGYVVWGWTENGQIPLYQSIYSGRAQFVGRLFDRQRPGDRQSFFSKIGQQLVNAEQIGRFTLEEITEADKRRLFTKKAMHIRAALLYWFNEGKMLPPIDFGTTMKQEFSLWGAYQPVIVKMPYIANSAWQGKDGSRLWLFVNTQQKPASAKPAVSSEKGFWICREGASKPVFAEVSTSVNLPALSTEIWIEGSRLQAEKIQQVLKRISSFDSGKPMHEAMKFTKKESKGIPGKKYTGLDSAGCFFCGLYPDKKRFGWVNDGAVISFGEIDFGDAGASNLTVSVGVSPVYAGGTITILVKGADRKEQIAAVIPLKNTGSFKNVRDVTVPLRFKLKGKNNVIFKIKGNGACVLYGWNYN